MPLRSVIPHLARAIAEKRSAQKWRFENPSMLGAQMRLHSSTKAAQANRFPQSSSRPKSLQAEQNSPVLKGINDSNEGRSFSIYFMAISGFAALLGCYTVFLYTNWTNSVVAHANSDDHLPFNADVSSRWKELGRDFDDEVEMSEKLMSMKKKRRRLAGQAYGNVLEVSVGTGRNLEYYDLRAFNPTRSSRRNIITHLTLNDQSDVIIAAAEKKLEKIVSKQEKTTTAKVDFVIGDAGASGVISRPEGGYDTIVQTMGVCSMVDPVGFLRRMSQLCRQPGEKSKTPERWRAEDDDGKGGQILLLEHGRGYFDWLNWVLDTGASLHAHRFGCWWNKDIETIVQQSGLEIEKIRRYHGGTTWMIVLRPKEQHETTDKSARVANLEVIPERKFSWFGSK